MLKVLWLCSWYPNKIEPYNGDFVQRHAQAASLYNQIHVLNLTPCLTDEGVAIMDTFHRKDYPNLVEQKIYYPKKFTLLGKVRSYYTWLNLYKEAVQKYIKKWSEPDLVHVNIPFKSGVIAQWIKSKYKIPYVVTEHWGGYNDVVKGNYNERPQWFKAIIRNSLKESSGLHSVSDFVGEQINNAVLPVQYVKIPNVVNTALFNYSGKPINEKYKLIHISNGAPVKNIEGLLSAFGELDKEKFELTIVGLTHLMNEKFRVIHPGVNFVDVIPQNELAELLKAQDCLIVFSNIENAPCVIGEALCCGLPVIATNVGGISELVDQKNSLLIPPRDESKLVAAIEAMYENRDKIDHAGISDTAIEKFRYEKVGKQFDNWYTQVLNR